MLKKLLRSITEGVLYTVYFFHVICIFYLTLTVFENDFMSINRLSAAIEGMASVLLLRMEAIWISTLDKLAPKGINEGNDICRLL